MKTFDSPAGLVQIKPVQVKYAAPLFQAIVDSRKELSEFLPWAKEQTLQDTKDYLYQCKSTVYRKQPLTFAIIIAGRPSGIVNLDGVDPDESSVEIGYWLGSDFYNLGIMTQVVEQMKDYVFSKLGLEWITLKAKHENIASQRVAEKTGFKEIAHDDVFITYEFEQLK
ncbi:GNAT family N-acetyltransferase [Fructobacillus sp. M2-14]|uniref:GNAT family N-acetyltransferase n=1 Tax=Fructobacillus broussonetiae TaxID=2713173 RepID=A0ABS5R1V9_9LACO|nr:GNAT family N-acetyltransferase [Fructobacillus broussonetiae]MBS9339232.1 GNAT family N-acetyltransferase [Fructobacillus broussonetiae]